MNFVLIYRYSCFPRFFCIFVSLRFSPVYLSLERRFSKPSGESARSPKGFFGFPLPSWECFQMLRDSVYFLSFRTRAFCGDTIQQHSHQIKCNATSKGWATYSGDGLYTANVENSKKQCSRQFACRFQDWECVHSREFDSLSKKLLIGSTGSWPSRRLTTGIRMPRSFKKN